MTEKIDQASDKGDSFTELVTSVSDYLTSDIKSIKDRLQLERKIRKYQDGNTSDWLLNLITEVHLRCQTKEKLSIKQ